MRISGWSSDVCSSDLEGHRLLLGGERSLAETGGYYLEPTIFGGLAPTSTLAREEVFGPVLGVMTFKHGADAIRIANDTVYGLAAGLDRKSTRLNSSH